ncbi:hypothetical protein TRVL_01753 [Trypanosoma vivax]|uniref:COPI associated protein n=1 Tax=Trypanosoma vivax (strain Y486) TaxID=1055687 RepID=G0U0V4_TRYVY|nr:hypothetical protein TRVL_01753 [Trypanosoma vivax]CCC49707.1 conserved hypothetical protein [Trypanosoma vivax Y486]
MSDTSTDKVKAYNKPVEYLMVFFAILCSIACGTITTHHLIFTKLLRIDDFRVAVVRFCIAILTVIIPSAELQAMRNIYVYRYARFLLSPIGRGFLYVIMGGVLLNQYVGDVAVGACMIALGLLSILTHHFRKPY